MTRAADSQAEEHRAHVGPERPELPVHPPLGVGALPQVFWPHRARPVPGGEVAYYGVGFPKHEPVIGDRGYQTVRVEREVLGITGEIPAPDLQHASTMSWPDLFDGRRE
jgi:hypothetical protein